MEAPSPFSAKLPKLQLAWDSTSLRALQFCPRYYQYSILEGYRGSSVDLEFGILAHGVVETFWRARLAGESRDAAQLAAVRFAVEQSGQRTEAGWVPWGGEYMEQWHCLGQTPYRNAKGNRAKCPYSHKGAWFLDDAPLTCGECGSDVEVVRRWVSNDKVKDRYTLVRFAVWYAEEQTEELEDGLRPLALPDGRAAIELPFRVPLPYQAGTGESFVLAGYLDRIVGFGAEHFVADLKTSRHALTRKYLAGFSPSTQMDLYGLAASVLWPSLTIRGILIDAVQLMVGGMRLAKHPIYHSEDQREEFLEELEFWLGQAEAFVLQGHWPMNRANCWNCPFNSTCSLPAHRRQEHLESTMERRFWNPLEER